MAAFTIGKKLIIGTGTLVAFTFALGVASFVCASNIGEKLDTITGPVMQKQVLAGQLAVNGAQLVSLTRGIMIRGYLKDVPVMDKYHGQFNATQAELQDHMDTISPLIVNPTARQAVTDIREYAKQIGEMEATAHKLAVADDMTGAIAAFLPMIAIEASLGTATKSILKVQEETVASNSQAATASVESSEWTTGVLVVLACGVGVALMFVILQIVRQLRGGVMELTETSVQIASAANQVASSSQAMAQGASEQAATIEETSSASAEINSMAQRTTESSRATAGIVTQSHEGFEKANQSLVEMVGAMDGISASSQKISKIIKVIDEIAFQTNILALNAAVEAARAGEAGMGFAVVADEVRNLAQRCAQAAKDTADLIEESIERSNGGRAKVDQVAIAIRTITAESSKIKVLVDEINLGSLEQSRGIDQISRSITQMEQVTQSSAAGAEEGAAAAEQLNAQAKTMNDVVEALRAMVDGSSNRGTAQFSFASPTMTPRKTYMLHA